VQGLDWFIQRSPTAMWNNSTIMYRLSPSLVLLTRRTKTICEHSVPPDLMKSCKEKIAEHFGFDGLTAYHLSFIAVSRCENGESHVDATNTGEKVLNAIIPFSLAEETGPEFQFECKSRL
jgi:hypothetical protein